MRLEGHPTTALEGSDNIVGWFEFHACMMLAYESGRKKQPGLVCESAREQPYIFRLQTYMEVQDELFKRRCKVVNSSIPSHSRRRRGMAAYARALLRQRQQRLTSSNRLKKSNLIVLVYVNPDMPDRESNTREAKGHSHLKPV